MPNFLSFRESLDDRANHMFEIHEDVMNEGSLGLISINYFCIIIFCLAVSIDLYAFKRVGG